MARLLVTGQATHIAARGLLGQIVERVRRDGHDGFLFGTQGEAAGDAVREADAVIAVLDDAGADTLAAVAFAAALDKPVLGLASARPDGLLADLAEIRTGADVPALLAHLPAFYERVRPFAGRVVRDRIPDLVREAGHDVRFREVTGDERAKLLKQKAAAEAQELLRADLAGEKEEVADVLEALEAFIRARGFERDDLRRVKEAKRKRRGGFDKVFVVESTAAGSQPNDTAHGINSTHDMAQASIPYDELPDGDDDARAGTPATTAQTASTATAAGTSRATPAATSTTTPPATPPPTQPRQSQFFEV